MKRTLLACFFLVSCAIVFAEEAKIPVVVDGDEINYLQEQSKVIARGHVKMQYKDVEVFCDEAEYDATKNIANIKGDVKIVRGGSTLYGKDVVFDFNTMDTKMGQMRVENYPFYGEAGEVERIGEKEYVLDNGYVTTCDLNVPHYRLVTKRIMVYPGDKVEAWNIVLMVGKIPVFYIPYFSQSLKERNFVAQIVPGKNSDWGYYILTRWRYALNAEQKGKINADWYNERGAGYGIDHKMESKTFGNALAKYYRLEDALYKTKNRDELFDRYPERTDIPAKRLEDDRYKAQLSYDLNPTPEFSVKAEVNKFSDEFFMKDFFRREHDIEPEPKTYALARYAFPYSSISLLGQKQVNRFFTETEYLPQAEYNLYRQSIGSSNFYITSDSTAGTLHFRPANLGIDDNASRLYSNNMLSYYEKIDWLYLNPYIGSENAFYSRNRFGEDDQWRNAPRAGIALSTKLYKQFETNWDVFGENIDSARHVLTPELSFDYRREPNISNDNLFQFDDLDDIAPEKMVTFSLKNKLQAKNENRTWDFLFFSPAVEYQLPQDGNGSHLNSVKTDFELYPRKGVGFETRTKYSLLSDKLTELNGDMTISGGTKTVREGTQEVEKNLYELSIGHRFTENEPNQGTLDLNYQLTPKLQLRNYLRYIYDSGDFQQQQYSLRQDLHCWWMDLGLNIDRRENGSDDYTIWVAFTLKAFPDMSFGFDQTYEGAKQQY